MIHVLLVDDHPMLREGLVSVLDDYDDIKVVGSVGTALGLVEQVDRLHPDVILMDLEMPGVDGITAIQALRTAGMAARVVVFTAYENEERVHAAMTAGAQGYVLKGATALEIALAIRTVNDGGVYLEPRVATRVVHSLGGFRGRLTDRERDVIKLIAQGLSNKQVADLLGITERTAKFHVTSILNKLGAENRAQAVALASQRGLI